MISPQETLFLNCSHRTPPQQSLTYLRQLGYYEPYGVGNTNAYGYAPTTGYPYCVNNRTDQAYTQQTGILLNGSRWTINQVGSGTTATYPEQTFTFSGDGDVYEHYVTHGNNMLTNVQGVVHGAQLVLEPQSLWVITLIQ